MAVFVYQRDSERFNLEALVMLEDFRTGFYYNGIIYNYSRSGVYFETDYAPRPGRKIRLKFHEYNNLPAPSSSLVYTAEIRWRCTLAENSSSYSFGVGAKYCRDAI
jgi:hypothetical protein